MVREPETGVRLRYRSGESAEDDPFRAALERAPSVEVVAGGADDVLADGDVDCAVSIHGDGVDGLALLEAVRERDPELPFVLVADAEDGMVASRAVAAGVSGYVPRGVDGAPRLLVDRVEAVTGGGDRARRERTDRMPVDELGVRDELRLKERAMDEAPVGITISDPDRPDNPLIYVNDAFEVVTGYPPEETVGRNCRFLQGEETDPDAVAAIREAIDREEPVSVELVNYRKGGEKFWNEVDIAPVRDGGEVTHYVGFQTDVTERKEAERAARRERRNLEQLLARIDGLVQDVTRELVQATSREAAERAVCERLAAVDAHEFAWIGRPDRSRDAIVPTAWAGDRNSAPADLDLDGDDRNPTVRAYETGESRIVDDPGRAADPADEAPVIDPEDHPGIAALPLAYRGTRYGVLTVHASRGGVLTEHEVVVLEALARATATAINALERGRILATDNVVDVEVEVRDPAFFVVDLSARHDCEVEYEGSVYRDDGSTLTFVTTDAAPSAVEAVAAAHPEVEEATLVNEHECGNLFAVALADTSIITTLAERGARTRSMTAADGTARVAIELPNETDARAVVDLLRERYPGTELAAYRERERPPQTREEFVSDLEDRLTERQLTALQNAYLSGFYEGDRPVTGGELAEAMDIARSTFHQHLRAAERKLVSEFLDR